MLYVRVTVSGHVKPSEISLTKVNVAGTIVDPIDEANPPAPVNAANDA